MTKVIITLLLVGGVLMMVIGGPIDTARGTGRQTNAFWILVIVGFLFLVAMQLLKGSG